MAKKTTKNNNTNNETMVILNAISSDIKGVNDNINELATMMKAFIMAQTPVAPATSVAEPTPVAPVTEPAKQVTKAPTPKPAKAKTTRSSAKAEDKYNEFKAEHGTPHVVRGTGKTYSHYVGLRNGDCDKLVCERENVCNNGGIHNYFRAEMLRLVNNDKNAFKWHKEVSAYEIIDLNIAKKLEAFSIDIDYATAESYRKRK